MIPSIAGTRPGPLYIFSRPLFWLYAAGLFTGTHWPRLEINLGVERSDLYVHVGAFGGWCILASCCGFFGPPLSPRNLHRSLLLTLVYAACDESSQLIPFIHRTACFDDFGANAGGIMLAALLLLAVSRRFAPPPSGA